MHRDVLKCELIRSDFHKPILHETTQSSTLPTCKSAQHCSGLFLLLWRRRWNRPWLMSSLLFLSVIRLIITLISKYVSKTAKLRNSVLPCVLSARGEITFLQNMHKQIGWGGRCPQLLATLIFLFCVFWWWWYNHNCKHTHKARSASQPWISYCYMCAVLLWETEWVCASLVAGHSVHGWLHTLTGPLHHRTLSLWQLPAPPPPVTIHLVFTVSFVSIASPELSVLQPPKKQIFPSKFYFHCVTLH